MAAVAGVSLIGCVTLFRAMVQAVAAAARQVRMGRRVPRAVAAASLPKAVMQRVDLHRAVEAIGMAHCASCHSLVVLAVADPAQQPLNPATAVVVVAALFSLPALGRSFFNPALFMPSEGQDFHRILILLLAVAQVARSGYWWFGIFIYHYYIEYRKPRLRSC